jgi:hypothetical protein
MSLTGWLRRVAPPSLTTIRRRYSANCYDLQMSVESDSDGWNVEVRDRQGSTTLHTARRCNLAAAKLAATEFAVVRMTGGMGAATVDLMAQHLSWNESW